MTSGSRPCRPRAAPRQGPADRRRRFPARLRRLDDRRRQRKGRLFDGGVAIAQPLPRASPRRSKRRITSNRPPARSRRRPRGDRPPHRLDGAAGARSLRAVGPVPGDRRLAATCASSSPTRPKPASSTSRSRSIPSACPQSFPAKVAALLWARWSALGAERAGPCFLPCELIEANGATLRRIVLASRPPLGPRTPAFVAWVEEKNAVPRHACRPHRPGLPGGRERDLFREWGYEDPLAVAAEPFHVWVIQGPKAIAAELPLAEAGLNVIWTDDLKPYRTRKVRILNGGHTVVRARRLPRRARHRRGDDAGSADLAPS